MGTFDGKVAVVTGGSVGVGRATAHRLAADGAAVVFCGRRPEAVEAAVGGMRAAGLAVTGLPVDVSDSAGVRLLVAEAVARHGGVDVVVNSAGVQRYGSV